MIAVIEDADTVETLFAVEFEFLSRVSEYLARI